MNSRKNNLWIITGPIQAGKTHFCDHLIKQAQKQGLNVAGVICPPVFTNHEKTAITIMDLKTQEVKTLAIVRTSETKDPLTDHWSFNEEVLAWGNQVLAETKGCDLLLIDELGPLEFNRRQGWQNGLHAIDQGAYINAVVVIRPTLLETAIKRWPHARVIDIPPGLDRASMENHITRILKSFS